MSSGPLLVVVGETGSGKSALALDLAQALNGEIICADSWTVYRGFDIGTAKPSAEDRELVPHHLLDVANPQDGFSAPLFQRLAQAAIQAITDRGKLPILVGGSGLYIDSILYSYSFLPPSDPAQREELSSLDLPQLLKRVEAMELDTSGIDVRNKRRLIRLIENNGVRPTRAALREKTIIIGIKISLDELKNRIEARIDGMVAAGFPDEVHRLGQQYGWDIEAMRAPGYRAFTDYINGAISLEAAKERFRQNDLQLAKKQRTWFKRNKSIQWFSAPVNSTDVVDSVTTQLKTL